MDVPTQSSKLRQGAIAATGRLKLKLVSTAAAAAESEGNGVARGKAGTHTQYRHCCSDILQAKIFDKLLLLLLPLPVTSTSTKFVLLTFVFLLRNSTDDYKLVRGHLQSTYHAHQLDKLKMSLPYVAPVSGHCCWISKSSNAPNTVATIR